MVEKLADLIPGGLADDKPDRLYKKDQVRKGIKVELEHVNDKDKAKEIAKDHLEEQREVGEVQNYYDKLMKMEGGKHAASSTIKQADYDKRVAEWEAIKAPSNHDKALQLLHGGASTAERASYIPDYMAMGALLPNDKVNWKHKAFDAAADDWYEKRKTPEEWKDDFESRQRYSQQSNPRTGRETIVGLQALIKKLTQEHASQTKKNAEDAGKEPDFQPLEANSTASRPISLHSDRLEKEHRRAGDEQARLVQETTDPDSGEFAGTPDQASKLESFDDEIGGLAKLIRQVKYNIKDTLTQSQARELGKRMGSETADVIRPEKAANIQQRKVSPHGYEMSFPETNRTSVKPDVNMSAVLGRNSDQGILTGRKSTVPTVAKSSYTGSGDITANSTPGAIEYNKAAENTMDVYEKRAAEVFDHRPSLIDPREIKVAFFFEGFADALEKRGFYVAKPTEFFVGLYESLREHFEGPTKLASGVYQPHVVNACTLFTKRMTKAAGFEQLQPVNPLDAGDQAQQNALGVSPQRQEKRQDIIDSMLPHAETISLDPDGKIKLKMPSPEASGVMDPGMAQQQQMAEMQGREQAQAANQTPMPTGEEAPAPMEQGQGGEQGEISPESLQAAEQAMSAGGMPGGEEGGMPGGEEGGMPGGGELPPELAQMMGGGGGEGGEGLGGQNELIQALMAQMQGAGSPG